jgi:hypothetical protein
MAVFMVINLVSFNPSSTSAQNATKAQAPVWFKQADQNGDGKLSLDEAPNKEVFGDVDTDQDGFASLSEVNAWLSTRRLRGQSFNPQPKARPSTNETDAKSDLASGYGLNDAAQLEHFQKNIRPVLVGEPGI